MLTFPRNQPLDPSPDPTGYPGHSNARQRSWHGRIATRAVFSFLRRRYKSIGLVAVLLGAPILYYVFSLPPEYNAVAYVLIDLRQTPLIDTQTATPSVAGDQSAVDTEVELVKAQPIALSVADKLMKSELWTTISGPEEAAGAGGDAPATPDEQRASVAEALTDGLIVSRVRQSYLMAISYSSDNPALAAFVANAFADSYLDDQLDAKFASMQRANNWLDARVADLRARVLTAERTAEDHRLRSQELTDLRAKSDAELTQRELDRETVATRTLLETFLARANEISQQKTLQVPESRIVTRATIPETPTGPNRAALGLVGILLGLGLGLGLAVLLEAMDSSVRSGGQAISEYGIRLLGAVPRHRRPRWRDRIGKSAFRRSQRIRSAAEEIVDKPFSTFSESVRSLRIAMRDANAEPCKVVMVTSALPNEGKSTIANCLAHYAASSGEKVLLVDFDPRRPVLTHTYASNAGQGLKEILTGQTAMADVLRILEPSALQFIPASESSPLMGGAGDERMRTFLDWARKAFDLVVIDAPPLIPVPDGRALVGLVDGVLFAVQWGKTSVDAVSVAIHHTPDLAGKILGMVLTQVNLRRARLYDIYSSGYDLRAYYAEGSKFRQRRQEEAGAP